MNSVIPFNKPYLSGNELSYIGEAMKAGKLAGDGIFTKRCHTFFEQQLGFAKVLLTTSCTDALEMAALLLDIQPGDEVIMPAYTYVSTPNAFVLRGARIIFVDSSAENPNLDVTRIEALITPRTRAIVPVHYAGIACDMDAIMAIAERHDLLVVEDAAQAIDSFYKGRPLGTIGHLAAFSFHETKNIISGEGGLLAVNAPRFVARAEILRGKGTNSASFFRGEADRYDWVDQGSSFLPSDMIAAFLWGQLQNMADIQARRKSLWDQYYVTLKPLADIGVQLPVLPDYATNNGHIFYLVCRTPAERSALIDHLRAQNINPVFHYLSLHASPFYAAKHEGLPLPNSDHYTQCLVRLPLFYELSKEQQNRVTGAVLDFYELPAGQQ
jgi:dTDP-4-amino-4,6-dideoxygalactose transaminase